MATKTRSNGEFCWINMLTPRPAEARQFFGTLFGWTYVEMPGAIGHSIAVGDCEIGGLFDLDGPQTPKGTLAHIGVMVKVEGADAVAAKVQALGGQARPPFDVMQAGRMAVCIDPNGAAFDVWEPKRMRGTEVDTNAHGAPCWFETLTTDVDRATNFYATLFGWVPQVIAAPGGMKYTVFTLGEQQVAGMMQLAPQMGCASAHWATNFRVNDVDESARNARELGATWRVPPTDIPGVLRFCALSSPQGVDFAIVKWAPR